MFPLSLTLIFLHLTATLCEYEFNYTVYDTIGTEVFANTTTDISIYKTTHFDCNLFLSENGTLRFRSDYDFNQQFNKLDFSCHFIGNETLLLFFYVHVIDTNDHAPVFYRTSYQLYVDEQFGAVIKKISVPLPFATDLDYSPFDIREYNLTGDSINFEYFTFLHENLTLVNKIAIDREDRSTFYFSISATDGGTPPRTSPVIPVTLTIDDVNDNSPQFYPHETEFSFPEDQALWLLIGDFSAFDVDIGSNSRIRYLLSVLRAFKGNQELDSDEFNSPFFFNVSTSEVWLSGELDFETYDRLQFTIEAIDFGQTPRWNTSAIVVYVTDVFDTPPRLRLSNVVDNVLQIREDEGNEFGAVLSIIFFSPKLPAYATANLTLMTSYEEDLFSIRLINDKPEWSLRFNHELDRETQSLYEIYFRLEVHNNVTTQTHINVTVVILDYNDNPPVIQDPPTGCVSFPEDTSYKILYTLNATDADLEESAIVSYSIFDAHGYESHFRINSTSGLVELITPLDYEEVNTLGVVLAATDAGTPPLTSTVTLNLCLENINDSAITFDSTFLLFPVNSPLHSKLATIQATDGDGTSQPIFYYLDSVPSELFVLDTETGELFLTTCLTHGLTIERTFRASHCASLTDDPILCELVTTQINISVSDSEPLLELTSYTVCLANDTQENTTLSLLSNNDASLNSIELTISTAGDNLTINVVDNHDSFVSHVTCREHSLCDITLNHECDANHTDSTSLSVLFVDGLQSTLQFTKQVYELAMDEGEYFNSTLKDFSKSICFDNYNVPMFSFMESSQESPYTISQSGLLSISGKLDYDTLNDTTSITLRIQAESNLLIANTTLIITVNPINEYTPSFVNFSQIVNVTNYLPHHFLTRFQAVDLDRGRDGELFYNMSVSLSWLELNESTGVLFISDSYTSAIQFKTNRPYNGTIIVRDGGSPPRMELRSFRLFLHDKVTPQSYWQFIIVTVSLLILIFIVLILITFLIMYFCRYKFCSYAIFNLDSTKSSNSWEVMENKIVGEDKLKTPLVHSTPRSSGLGVSFDSNQSSVVRMTDEQIQQMIYLNRHILHSDVPPTPIDFKEEPLEPPEPVRRDNPLDIEYVDGLSEYTDSQSELPPRYKPPLDFPYDDTDSFWKPSHSPQSSVTSSYFSSVSHHRPKIPSDNQQNLYLCPLPSTSTPIFSRTVINQQVQPESLCSIEPPV